MKSIKIKIPEPCHEDWAKMTKEAKGRFCDSCEKVVHDMSKLTDNEIVSLVTNGEKICGRFRNDQLDRPMYESVPYKPKKSGWAIAASLLVGLSLLSSCSTQGEPEPLVGEVTTVDNQVDISVIENIDSSELVVGDTIMIDDKSCSKDVPEELGEIQVEMPPEEPVNEVMGVPIAPDHPEGVPLEIHTAGEPVIIDLPDSTKK